jgi:hypothetical protein
MYKDAKEVLELAKQLQKASPTTFVPPSEGTKAASESVLPFVLVRGTRGYIEKVVNQINGCYERGWFDSCAVMMRRAIETLIIECFEGHGIDAKIKNKDGDFLYLGDLIDKTLAETAWNLGRNTKKGLPKLKTIGDHSAHNRRYNAVRDDIDKISTDFRVVCEDLLYISKLKK